MVKEIELKRSKENYELNLYGGKGRRKSVYYSNVVTKDKNIIAQILIDLYLEGFPIEGAIDIFNRRVKKRDWLGF